MPLREDEFRCMKCKSNVLGDNICLAMLQGRGGERPALRATCSDCGTKMFKLVKAADANKLADRYGVCSR